MQWPGQPFSLAFDGLLLFRGDRLEFLLLDIYLLNRDGVFFLALFLNMRFHLEDWLEPIAKLLHLGLPFHDGTQLRDSVGVRHQFVDPLTEEGVQLFHLGDGEIDIRV